MQKRVGIDCEDEVVEGEDAVEEDDSMLRQFRFEIAHKRWPALYDREDALKLKAAML